MSLNRIFSSPLFTFLIGENEEPISVHAAAIAKQSKALDTLINGPMVEAQVRSVSLRDVSVEDFLKFCQFAYTGDYSTPSSTTRAETSLPSKADEKYPASDPPSAKAAVLAPPPSPLSDEDTWASFRAKTKKVPSKTTLLRESFDRQSYCPVPPKQQFHDACQIVTNGKCTEDYSPVFLAHARLYVLADKYGVESLKCLCLDKIHKTLVNFTLYKESIGDIAELVRFSYCNDHTPDDANDDLRALVLKFVASRHDDIGDSEPFLSLVEEGGVFARDLWIFTRKHLF